MLDFLERNKKPLAAIAGIVLLTLFAVAAFQTWRLGVATEERQKAELEVAKATAVAEAKQQALEEITKVTGQQIEAANELISKMQAQVAASQRREAAAVQDRNRIIQDRAGMLNSVQYEGDTGLATSTAQVASVLFDEPDVQIVSTSQGFVLSRKTLEVFKKSLIEVSSRRESEAKLEQIAEERSRQIERLQSVIDEDGKKYDALEVRMQSVEDRLNAVVQERDSYKNLAERFEKENEALRKASFWNTWKGRAVNVGVLIGGIVLGNALAN